ncbi:MAG: hypothetical protein SF052_25570 [Bacteroidia bacterium]|nr:hypothetical protein [Bacteroidia bacterium]
MKKLLTPVILFITLSSSFLSGCIQDKCEQTVTYFNYLPVYKSYAEIRASVQSEPAKDIVTPGKIYFKDAYIFISEVNKGIHIINNSNPYSPQNIGFINIPGNHDLAIKGNTLYADSYVDLLALDITDLTNVTVADRDENVFPYGWHHDGLWADPDSGIAVDWVEKEISETVDCGNNGGVFFDMPNVFIRSDVMAMGVQEFASNSTIKNDALGGNSGNSEFGTGVGGSLARFTIVNDYLYAVTWTDLEVFDITDMAHPQSVREVPIGWDIETIFPTNNRLFIGAMSGMFIYSLDNPTNPTYLSQFSHVRSCDPVVVENDYAFVTLKNESGNVCDGFANQLDVINISDLTKPNLEYTYSMTAPSGLGIRNGVLFICDGSAGLKVYDATDVSKINKNLLAQFSDIQVTDVIPLHNLLLAIGKGGLYQYDYSDLQDIKQISLIPVVNE